MIITGLYLGKNNENLFNVSFEVFDKIPFFTPKSPSSGIFKKFFLLAPLGFGINQEK